MRTRLTTNQLYEVARTLDDARIQTAGCRELRFGVAIVSSSEWLCNRSIGLHARDRRGTERSIVIWDAPSTVVKEEPEPDDEVILIIDDEEDTNG